jgi:drug/metabolite transporter (DMT)-like permease
MSRSPRPDGHGGWSAYAACEYAPNTSLVTFLIPISSLLLGYLFRDETFGLTLVFGMALIAAGMAVIDGRLQHLPW